MSRTLEIRSWDPSGNIKQRYEPAVRGAAFGHFRVVMVFKTSHLRLGWDHLGSGIGRAEKRTLRKPHEIVREDRKRRGDQDGVIWEGGGIESLVPLR